MADRTAHSRRSVQKLWRIHLAMLIYRDRGVKVKIRINVPVRVNPVQITARYSHSSRKAKPNPSGVPRRGLGGLEPLPLAYDLRNKRARMRQNMVFSTKNTKNFLGKGHSPLPKPFPQWERGIPPPHAAPPSAPPPVAPRTPPILKFWVRHCLTLILSVILTLLIHVYP